MTNKLVVAFTSVVFAGCATQTKPDYELVTNFSPDCKNEAAQIRYLTKLKNFSSLGDVSNEKFNTTIDIQIDRLKFYCRNED